MRKRHWGVIALAVSGLMVFGPVTTTAAFASPVAGGHFDADTSIGAPSAPLNVHGSITLGSDNVNHFHGSWDAPADDGGSPITGYTIDLSDAYGDTVADTVVQGTTYDGAITSPVGGGSYVFSVVASNGVDDSAPAYAPDSMTPISPVKSPTTITVTPHQTSAVVTWNASDTSGGQAIGEYLVWLYDAGGNLVDSASTLGTEFSHTFTGLSPLTSYTVYVSAMAGVATSATMDSGRQFTTVIDAPDAPTNVAMTVIDATHVHVTWDAPANDGGAPVTSYGLDVVGGDSADIHSIETGTSADVEIVGHEGVSFTASVVADNGVGDSPAGVSAAVTMPSRPDAPTNVISVLGGDIDAGYTIDVAWSASATATSYLVTVTDSAGGITTTTVTANSASVPLPSRTLSYTASVTAINDVGSSTAVETTSPDVDIPTSVPSAPLDLAITRSLIADAFIVTWGAPADDGGFPMTGYLVTVLDGNGNQVASYDEDAGTLAQDVAGLPIMADYTVYVTPENSAGSGSDASASFLYWWFEALAPTNVQATTATTSTADLRWDAPAYDGGQPIAGYRVRETGSDGSVWYDYIAGDVTSGVAHFPPTVGVSYTFAMMTDNGAYSDQWSAESNSVDTATAPDAPFLGAIALGYHDPTLFVYFVAPNDNGSPITGYTVTLTDSSGTVLATRQVATVGQPIQFDGLDSATSYHASIVATNAIGDSAAGVTDVTTNPDAPLAPLRVPPQGTGTGTISSVVIDGTTLTADLDGLPDGEWVYGYLYSAPQAIGWTQVHGGVATWDITGSSLPAGVHHLVVLDNQGLLVDSAAFTIAGPPVIPARVLATTGTDGGGGFLGALAMLIVGGAALALRRRRRARLARTAPRSPLLYPRISEGEYPTSP